MKESPRSLCDVAGHGHEYGYCHWQVIEPGGIYTWQVWVVDGVAYTTCAGFFEVAELQDG